MELSERFWSRDPDCAPLGAYSCADLTVLDSPKVHVKLKCSSFSESRDNRGVPNLQFWSRDPEHAPRRGEFLRGFDSTR